MVLRRPDDGSLFEFSPVPDAIRHGRSHRDTPAIPARGPAQPRRQRTIPRATGPPVPARLPFCSTGRNYRSAAKPVAICVLTNGGIASHPCGDRVGRHQTVVRERSRYLAERLPRHRVDSSRRGNTGHRAHSNSACARALLDELPVEQPVPTSPFAIATLPIEKPQRPKPEPVNHKPDSPALAAERLSLEALRRELESRRAGVEDGLAELTEEDLVFDSARSQFESDLSELEGIGESGRRSRAACFRTGRARTAARRSRPTVCSSGANWTRWLPSRRPRKTSRALAERRLNAANSMRSRLRSTPIARICKRSGGNSLRSDP